MRKSEKGSVLVFVLVTAVVIAIIAAGLTRMMIMRAFAAQRMQEGNVNKKKAEAAINLVTSVWNMAGTNNIGALCANASDVPAPMSAPAGYSYTCSGATPGHCGCTCTSSDPTAATITTSGADTACTIAATTPP